MDLEQQLATDRVEARSVAFTDVDTSNDGWSFTGYAAVFDVETDLGSFTESMSRGSFRKALSRGENVPMLMEHNPTLPVLATTAGGTLKLAEDTKGLRVEADIAKHYIGEAVRELVKRGDIRGMSVGFRSGRGNSRIENRGGRPHRSILDFKKILDVSPTWEPAYPGTSAELRSLRALQMADGIEQVQQLLTGAATQLEDGAPADEAEPSDEQDAKCNKCGATLDEGVEHECAGSEAPSGVSETRSLLAARKRRLALLGVTLPKDPT